MNNFINHIKNQLKHNRDKNIFDDDPDLFQFTDETIQSISGFCKLDQDTQKFLIEYTVDKAIEEFCRVNQYYTFDLKARKELSFIYKELVENFQFQKISMDEISRNHYLKLKNWLKTHNSFAEQIYLDKGKTVEPITCSEYNAALQIRILHLDVSKIGQPVLDIGCGKNAYLVNFLKQEGIEVKGIDRLRFSDSNLISADWLDFDYGNRNWGTIVSNLGFSNHFNHHNLRSDGNYIDYANTYMKILNALKKGGSFHYAPDLSFIEQYLAADQFDINNYLIEGVGYKTTVIRKLN